MLRLKYKLYQSGQPHNAITTAVPSINPATDMFLGQWPSEDWLYGEINTDSGNQTTLETALVNWSGTFLSDNDAKSYVDGILPAGTVLQKKRTSDAASIVDGHVVKTYTEYE